MADLDTGHEREVTPAAVSLGELMTDPTRRERYQDLRQQAAVVPARYFDGTPMWLITRYEEARTALADPRLVSDSSKHGGLTPASATAMPADVAMYLSGSMLDRDAPDHARLRKPVARVFTPRRVEALRERTREIARQLLPAGVEGDDPVDLVQALCNPLPIAVICELFGVPDAHRPLWAAHAQSLTEIGPGMVEAARGLISLAQDLLKLKRDEPDDGLISDLLRLQEQDSTLSETELVTTVITLLGTGHESTVQLLSNSLLALLTHPAHATLMRDSPDRIPQAVQEYLRYFTPFELSGLRFADEAMQIGGCPIRSGDPVQVLIAAADRDPSAFPGADEIDIQRGNAGDHLALGHGPHFCLGAALAKMEAEVVLQDLLSRFPRARLAVPVDQVQWRRAFVAGPISLPVQLNP